MGLWSLELERMAAMMTKLPSRAMMQMERNRMKSETWSWGLLESPRMMNVVTMLWFFIPGAPEIVADEGNSF